MGLRITFVLPHLSLSGGDKITVTFANGLAERGHEVTVVHGRPTSFRARLRQLIFSGSRNFHLPGPKVRLLGANGPPASLPRYLPDADVLIASWWETVESLSKAPQSKGQLIHHVQDHEVFPYLPSRSAEVYRIDCPKIAVSKWILQTLENTYGCSDVRLVTNPVDTNQFNSITRLMSQYPVIGTVYSSAPRKNSLMAFEAIQISRKYIPDLRLVCFGAESLPSNLYELPFVQFFMRPRQDIIPKLYSKADYWLFTSVSEGFGLPILEAMAVGTPVIATRAGAAPELVTDMSGAMVSHHPSEMAEAICRLSAISPPSWLEMSRASRAIAEQHDVQSAVRKFEEIICAVASRR